MKKSGILAVALAAGISLMGAGYAAWETQLNINATATTGNFDIQMADGTVGVYTSASATSEDGVTHTLKTATVSLPDKHTETVTVNNLYPGAVVKVSIPVANVGSIEARLANGESLLNISDEAKAILGTPDVYAPPTLAATTGTGNITVEFTVPTGTPESTVPQNTPVTFSVNPNYVQFNQ